MMPYRLTATIDCADEHGGNVADWFKELARGVTVFDVLYESAEQAIAVAKTHYLGPDTDGIGVSWKAEEIAV